LRGEKQERFDLVEYYASLYNGSDKERGRDSRQMADQQHLDLLKQGIDGWNTWRQEHPEIQPDLYEADLGNANLRMANLSGADLREAIVEDALFINTTSVPSKD
jgi:hypothetical protein